MSGGELFVFSPTYVELFRSDMSSHQVVYLAGSFDAGDIRGIWCLFPL